MVLTGILLGSAFSFVAHQMNPLTDAAAAANDKATVDPAKSAIKQGETAMYKHDYAGAIDKFKQAIYFSRNQYNPTGWKYLAMAYKAERDYPKAIEAFNKHLSQVTEPSVAARCDLADCFIQMKDYEKARREIQKANVESQGVTDAMVICAFAKLDEKMEKWETAHKRFEISIKRDKHLTEALMGRARMEVRLGMKYYPQGQWLNKAFKHYLELIDNRHKLHGVNFEEVYYNMAQIYYKKGDHQNAIDHLHYILKDFPNSFTSHIALGKIFDDEKHYSSAIKQYELAIPNAPHGTDVEKIKARILYLQQLSKGGGAPAAVNPSPLMRQQLKQPQPQGSLDNSYEKAPLSPTGSGF
jgi:tetratricopeptide (TPR) repeat protein